MGRPPAYIFVVRHGHRLDAADKQWHLTSPAPYDPPLTYKGWLQTHALGAKISSILRERIQQDEAATARDPNSSTKRKRRKYKIIVHSSPFLRCVQTSVGLSCGIAKDPTPLHTPLPDDTIEIGNLNLSSHKFRGGVEVDGHGSNSQNRGTTLQLHETRKAVLRLDAFLGEWLTPGYFELITPPPESVMMLATAKADLLRPENYETSFPAYVSHVHSSSQGQLWNSSPRTSSVSVTSSPTQPDGYDNFPHATGSLTRSSSLSNQHGSPSVSAPARTGGYVAPVPHYAISSSATIPLGYVAHARDACVKVDYQWDSMRGPLEWGDGGRFGEEWPDMHRRFRDGVQNLVNWYASAENPTEMVTRTARWTRKTPEDPECAIESDPEDDEDTEAIVILVSHGAGCNALIGALTHQPVLMDVSMASLTMAVRKPLDEIHTLEKQHGMKNGHAVQFPIHKYYDTPLLASTEHLRSNSQSSSHGLNRSPSTSAPGPRGRFASPSPSPLKIASHADSHATPATLISTDSRRPSGASPAAEQRGSWANARSGITVGSGVTSFSIPNRASGLSRTPSIGLWSPVPRDEDDDDDDSIVLNFSHERIHPTDPPQKPVPTLEPTTPERSREGVDGVKENDSSRRSGGLAKSQSEAFLSRKGDGDETPKARAAGGLAVGGLWAPGPRPLGEAEVVRDLSAAKRRWTFTEMETRL